MTGSGIDALGLAEPLRRRLYDYVADHGGEISRAPTPAHRRDST
ncbi:hypothetical protein [Streptomonospora wellingtoniae]|uniref:Uncharacterized protein n=1 Tax=Streptomonospora wellingtoniae TaxID=3075544 RepID=A0ABU2KZD4_9ACTN|nr:hypothetical protein [Streptomonospora sp. DSM 45055]MDT0304438.1 hypothetical protein [Streptomonospora sp. DSM 45055]